jgi:hypothetical protein
MAAFRMDQYGRDARSRFQRGGDIQFSRGENAWRRGDNQYDIGNFWQNRLNEDYNAQANSRFASPEQLHQYGNEAMPWANQMLDDRRGRVNQMSQNYDNLGPIDNTIDSHSSRFDEMGRNIGRNFDAIGGDINDLHNRLNTREEDFHGDIRNNITGTYGSLQDHNRDSYGNLDRETRDTYGRAIGDVRPGSEARSATAARAFAPQMASTMMRLRRAGIDPASSEAQAMLRNVEGQRSRVMDDTLGQAIGQTNQLRLGQLGATTNLERERADIERGLGLGQMEGYEPGVGADAEQPPRDRPRHDRDADGQPRHPLPAYAGLPRRPGQ